MSMSFSRRQYGAGPFCGGSGLSNQGRTPRLHGVCPHRLEADKLDASVAGAEEHPDRLEAHLGALLTLQLHVLRTYVSIHEIRSKWIDTYHAISPRQFCTGRQGVRCKTRKY